MLKLIRARIRTMPSWLIRTSASVLAVSTIVAAMWFYTPVPTLAARHVWKQYQGGTLTLMLDRTDTLLAMEIGEYYFGNQAAIGTSGARPYNLPLAVKAFGKAIEINPTIAIAHYMRARIEFVYADFNAALADLNAELLLYPTNKRTLYMRGLTYAYRGLPGDLVLAEQDFEAFTAWAPREWAGYNDLAFVLAKEKKYSDAAKVLKEAIAKAEGGAENPWLWDALGIMELNVHNPSQAVFALTKAQKYASMLTETDWQRAYPGNNPSMALFGIEAIQGGIAKNILKAYAALGR